jgi:hypothetical protein
MKGSLFFLLIVLILPVALFSQTYRLTGKVANKQLEPLSFASVQVKGHKFGQITKEDGTYVLNLEEGQYEIVVTMIGYQPRVVPVTVNKNTEQNFILEEENKDLGEVVIKAKLKDRAEEIIRKVIAIKDSLDAASGAYTCNIYIKATQQQDSFFIKGNKAKPDTINLPNPYGGLDKMAMAEVSMKYDHGTGQQYKEERLGVTKRGETGNLFYLSATEGEFNLYNNLIKIPGVSQIPFISPVSYSGLVAYRFKTIKRERVGKHWNYIISIRPRQLSNATVEGEITISDSSLTILHAKFTLPNFHTPEYDFFEIEQDYGFVNNNAWMITRQKFTYYSKYGKGKKSGETIAVFRNYELNKKFNKGYFGNEVSVTSVAAYHRDSLFWNQIRTEPLTGKEMRFIQYKDSIYNVTHSRSYLDSLDDAINRVTWKNVLFLGQMFNNHNTETRWMLPPLTSIIQPFQFGGTRINLSGYYSKTFASRKDMAVMLNTSYGLRNHDVNGSVSFSRKYNPFNGGSYTITAGRDFQYIYEGDAWINMLKRSNIYLNNSFGVGHTLGITSGLYLTNEFDIAFRRSVSDYETNPKADSLFGGNNQPVDFESYNAFYTRIKLQYTPKMKYVREPRERILLGSKWPTFYVMWRKGMPNVFKSKIDFDYLEFGIEQKLKLGTLGNSSYRIKTGSFLNTKDLRLVDYQFQRRGDPLLFSSPHKSFQALDSTFPLFNRFYEAHYVHEFNGLLLNKIPLLKKLKLREVAGTGFLVAPERDLKYLELFAGIERVIKWPFNPLTKFKIGVYVVGSAANSKANPVQFKIGITKWDWLKNRWL